MNARAALFAAALALAAAPGRARADGSPTLDRAQKSIDDVDYDTAKTLVDQALSAGGLEPADLARAHHLAGECAAALGDDAGARDHFVRWLLLDPDAHLAEGVSPKITEPFAAAKQQAAQLGAMTIDVRVEREPGKLHVFLDTRDPLHMIAGLRVRKDDGQAAQERGTSVELPADDTATVTLDVLVLDDQGDQIAVKTVTSQPSGGAVVTHDGGKGWPAVVRWPTWTAFAVIGLGAGGYFGWETSKDKSALDALNADSANHTFEDAQAIVDRGERHARYANIGFIVGGAFAAIGVVTLFIEPKHHHAVEVAPAAAGADVGASAIVHF